MEINRYTLGLLVVLLFLPFVLPYATADEPPYEFEILYPIPDSRSGVHQHVIDFERNGTIRWSFESDVPLELYIEDFHPYVDGGRLATVNNKTRGDGELDVVAGRYGFIFINYGNETAHVTLDYHYTSDEGEGQWMAWMGVIAIVAVLIVAALLVFSKRRRASTPVPQSSIDQLKECPSCGSFNSPDAQYCEYCAKPL